MFKEYLLNCIVKELKICRRLASKIPADKMTFRSKEGVRSIQELLHYLSYSGTDMLRFWYRTDGSDSKTFFAAIEAESVINSPQDFIAAMDKQIEDVTVFFNKFSEEELHTKIVTYPWKATAPLGEAIVETIIKWLAAYKLQLFSLLKLATDQKLVTADAWRHTEID